MIAKPAPSPLFGIMLMDAENRGRIEVKIQGVLTQKLPQNCIGHYASNDKRCLACRNDGECKNALAMTFNIKIVRAPAMHVKKIEG